MGRLLAGIMCLVSPTDSIESETLSTFKAKKMTSQKSLQSSPDVVGFCMGLARWDTELVEGFARQVGEFNTKIVEDLFVLISRLVPIIKQGSGNKVPEGASDAHESASNHSENTGDNDKTTNNGNSGSGSRVKALQLAQNNENTGQFSPEVLFRMRTQWC